jgi:uncharacterized protein (DUF1501 family)
MPSPLFVQVFLRGGCDALSLLPPIDGPDRKIYEQERPGLKIPLSGEHKALPLTEAFGLHPACKPLHEIYQSKQLAAVLAVGLWTPSRSHFDAQAMIETGALDAKRPMADGWLARLASEPELPRRPALAAGLPAGGAPSPAASARAPVSAVGLGSLLPMSLLGCERALALADIDNFNLGSRDSQDPQRAALRRMYASAQDGWAAATATATLDAIDELEMARERLKGKPGLVPTAEFPAGEIGKRFRLLLQLIKMDLPLRAAAIDMGGWDTHKYQGNGGEGTFAGLAGQLAQSLAVFWNELAKLPAAPRARIAVASEFGRRVKENGNAGTDHGHGGFFMALGRDVSGGRVLGRWPGLAAEQLFERADVAVATDVRGPLLELAGALPGSPAGKRLFPGYAPPSGSILGLVRA